MKYLMVQDMIDLMLAHDDRARIVFVKDDGTEITLMEDTTPTLEFRPKTETYVKNDGNQGERPVLEIKVVGA